MDSMKFGGKERRMAELLKVLPERNIHAELVLFKTPPPKIPYGINVKIQIINRWVKKDPFIFFRLFAICKKFRPDIIHSWGSMPSVYAFPICKLLNIKLINAMITNANTPRFLSSEWIRSKLTFPFSDIIVSNSLAGLKAYNVLKGKSFCIYNGFNFDRIKNLKSQKNIREKFNITTEHIVGMAAIFDLKKDYNTYFNAALKILKKRNDVTFLAIGGGELLESFKYKPEYQNKNIVFTGDQHDVESIISILSIGVLCSNFKVHKEGISNSLLEYLALGIPVIATYGGGTNEIIINNKNGFLIEPYDVDALANKIQLLLNEPHLCKKFAANGKEMINKNFSIERMVNKTIEIYNNVMVKKGG